MQTPRDAPDQHTICEVNHKTCNGSGRLSSTSSFVLTLSCALFISLPATPSRAENPGAWLAHGRTNAEQRYSPLETINAENVSSLMRLWTLDTGTTRSPGRPTWTSRAAQSKLMFRARERKPTANACIISGARVTTEQERFRQA